MNDRDRMNPYRVGVLHAVVTAVLLIAGICFTEWVNPDSGRPSNQEIADRFKLGDWTALDRKTLHQRALAVQPRSSQNPVFGKDAVQIILDRLDKVDARLQRVEANTRQLDSRLRRVEANTRKPPAPNASTP